MAEEKTRILRFGKRAWREWKDKGDDDEPGTFDFLGFTHYCGASRKGTFRVKRKTSGKKLRNSLHRVEEWAKTNRHEKLHKLLDMLAKKVSGHYRYYGITDNIQELKVFHREVCRKMVKWLNRRSQRRSITWKQWVRIEAKIPKPKIFVNIYKVKQGNAR